MSRMTLLQGEIWLGSGPESGLPRFVRAPEAGYPPYNVELLPEGDGTRSTLRITLAVAGFSVVELAVTVEGGQLIVRGKQTEYGARDYLYRGIAARRFKRSFGLADGVECEELSCTMGCSPSNSIGPSRTRRSGRCGSPMARRPNRAKPQSTMRSK